MVHCSGPGSECVNSALPEQQATGGKSMEANKSSLRQQLKDLYAEKTNIENEIEHISNTLNTPVSDTLPPVGLKGNLIDREGFPRADVDVHQIRTLRHRYSCLQTDHKEMMKQIEHKLKQIMALPLDEEGTSGTFVETRKEVGTKQTTPVQSQPGSANKGLKALVAFLSVEAVDDQSPAEDSGLLSGDLVLQFGSVLLKKHEKSAEALKRIVAEVGNNINKTIRVLVERNMQRLSLDLTPRQWEGRGFLGCKLVPL